MFFIFLPGLAAVLGKLVAVVELARVPSAYPVAEFAFSSEEERKMAGRIHEVGLAEAEKLALEIRERYLDVFKDNFRLNSTGFVKNDSVAADAMKVQMKVLLALGEEVGLGGWMRPIEEDLITSPEASCKKLQDQLLKNIEKFEKHELYIAAAQIPQLSSILPQISVTSLYQLGGYLVSCQDRRQSHPLPLSQSDSDKIIEVYHKYHEWLLYGSKEQGKLALHEIFRTLSEYLKVSKRPGKYQRFLPYMMDSGLFLAALHLLGLDFAPKPPASAIFIEVHFVANKFTVRFWNRSQYVESEICGLECRLDEFCEYLEGQLHAVGIKRSCGNLGGGGSVKDHWSVKYVVAAVALMFMVTIAKYFKGLEGMLLKNKSE